MSTAVHGAPPRDGLVAPWTAVPTLVALAADPVPELGALALRLLRREESKAPQQLDKCIGEGVPLAYKLCKAAAQAFAAHGNQQGARPEVKHAAVN